jgi:hypothetical protein
VRRTIDSNLILKVFIANSARVVEDIGSEFVALSRYGLNIVIGNQIIRGVRGLSQDPYPCY